MRPSAVIVFDTHAEALGRRVRAAREAFPDASIRGTSSSSAVLIAVQAAPERTIVLVDLFASDRLSFDRPGIRLIRRLSRHPATAHAAAVAWSAQRSPDVVADARRAGADGYVMASLDEEAEQELLRRVGAGEEVWPDAVGTSAANWEAWFREAFGVAWEPWVEPVLVRLASGREKRAATEELVERGAARSRGHAATRLRQVAAAVAGEHRNSVADVAAGASLALSQIAAHRQLGEQPVPAVSLELGARAVRTAPSLVRAAALTPDEEREILAIDALITAKRLAEPQTAGAPEADRVRNERRWAAGRRAADLGAERQRIDEVIDGTLLRLDEALVALDDARQDELYHPEARAAAALSLLDAATADAVEDVTVVDGTPRWRDRSPAELAFADDLDVGDLRAFIASVDARLAPREP